MARRHIPSYEVVFGAEVFVVPRDATIPRGPRLGPIAKAGAVVRVDDYVLGCIQRGALTAYSVAEEASSPPSIAPAAAPGKGEPTAPAPPAGTSPQAPAPSAAVAVDASADKEKA
jgi:hypothetical protein